MPSIASIADQQNQVIDDFAVFDQWTERYEYLIDLGRNLPPLADGHKVDANLIPGCQSRVWLHASGNATEVLFAADSDAIITKGIIALLLRVLSHQPAAQIAQTELYFIERIGLVEHLSPTRSNGLVNMVATIKATARTLAESS